jgi:LuxR family maltose regulon positive regulatory protein
MIVTQTAGQYAMALLRAGRADDAGRVCQQAAPVAAALERAWGEGAGASLSRLRTVEGRLAHRAGDLPGAATTLEWAARMARVWGEGTYLIDALVALADVRLASGDAEGARRALSVARETADAEQVRLVAGRKLAAAEARAGRGAARAARRAGQLVEELTDRELSILRMLPGSATQREIGAALFLSVNTVKGYTKSLYRKLDVPTRTAAVERARELGLL